MGNKTSLKTLLVMSILLVGIHCTVAVGRTIYVDAGAMGANSGSNWINAYNRLEDALAAPTSSDEILLANGTYKPEQEDRVKLSEFNGNDSASFDNNEENNKNVVTESGTGATTEMIYWTTVFGRSIERSSLDSPEIEVVLSGVNVTQGIALDMIGGKVYWTGGQPSGIYWANLDGTDIELLIGECGPGGLCSHHNIALDLVAEKMYWTDSGIRREFYKLRRANLDGTDVEDVIAPTALKRPYGIALDLAAGKVYWGEGVESQGEKGKIRRANLDGSDIEDLVEVGWCTFGLELDLVDGKMYWTNNNEGELWRANLDGTMKELLMAGLHNPLGLALDLAEGKIYCAEHHAGKIIRTNLDGTEVEDFLVTDLGKVQGLALTIIPEIIIEAAVDIKPGSCPNPLNVKSKGVLPVAVLGSEDLDINTIDVTSVRLVGIPPVRSSYEDVATPVSDANDCNCTTDGPDGFLDLTLKFKTQEIVEAIGVVNDGDILSLELTGVLFGERPIEGADCVLIRGKHKPFNKADVNKDGMVDMLDFAIITENWLQSSIIED